MLGIPPYWAWHYRLPRSSPLRPPDLPGNGPVPAAGYPPNPCSVAVCMLAEAVSAKQAAAALPEGRLRAQLEHRAERSIEQLLDDVCGTPWPWPGPPPWVVDIASELMAMANSAHTDAVRAELIRISARAIERSSNET